MEKHSDHNSAMSSMKPVNNHILANACGTSGYSEYCYLYNIALNAILDYFNSSQPQVHPIFQEISNLSNHGYVQSGSKTFLTTTNHSLQFFRRGLNVKPFAKRLASQPNIIQKPIQKDCYDEFLHETISKKHKLKLLKCLEKRKKAKEAKERLLKAKSQWREATVYGNTSDFKK